MTPVCASEARRHLKTSPDKNLPGASQEFTQTRLRDRSSDTRHLKIIIDARKENFLNHQMSHGIVKEARSVICDKACF